MAELQSANYDADKLPKGKLRLVFSFFFFLNAGIMPICLTLTKWNCLIQWSNYEKLLVLLLMLKLNQ
jgi:hypothetical protein